MEQFKYGDETSALYMQYIVVKNDVDASLTNTGETLHLQDSGFSVWYSAFVLQRWQSALTNDLQHKSNSLMNIYTGAKGVQHIRSAHACTRPRSHTHTHTHTHTQDHNQVDNLANKLLGIRREPLSNVDGTFCDHYRLWYLKLMETIYRLNK